MSGERRKILILDTDPEFLIVLERVLEEEGFETTTTWDPGEAIRHLASQHYNVLLVGEHPPEIRMNDILKRLPTNRISTTWIVLQSAARYPFEAQYLSALGAYAVIPKWKHKRIVEAVHQLTAMAEFNTLAIASAIGMSSKPKTTF